MIKPNIMLTSKKERRYAEGLQKYKKYVKVGKYICTRKICFVEKLNEQNNVSIKTKIL